MTAERLCDGAGFFWDHAPEWQKPAPDQVRGRLWSENAIANARPCGSSAKQLIFLHDALIGLARALDAIGDFAVRLGKLSHNLVAGRQWRKVARVLHQLDGLTDMEFVRHALPPALHDGIAPAGSAGSQRGATRRHNVFKFSALVLPRFCSVT